MKGPTFDELREKYFGKLVKVGYSTNREIGLIVTLKQEWVGCYSVGILFKNKVSTMNTYHFTVIELIEDTEEGDSGEDIEVL